MVDSLATQEREKYELAWALPEYHKVSPAEKFLPLFLEREGVTPTRVLDIGCGTGRASQQLKDAGWAPTLLDHVDVPGRPKELPFLLVNLWEPWKGLERWPHGLCCDVLEHLPPEKVDAALVNIFENCERVFFSICFVKDHFGQKVGHPLHLTVRPFEWWLETLNQFGDVVNARDLLQEGVFDVCR